MKRSCIAMSLAVAIIFFSTPAWAYVDPGSGSLIIQMLVAAGVGAMFYFRQFREKIKSLFSGRNGKLKDASTDRSDKAD